MKKVKVILISLFIVVGFVIVSFFINSNNVIKNEIIPGVVIDDYEEYKISNKLVIKATLNTEEKLEIKSNDKIIMELPEGNYVDFVEKLNDKEFLIKVNEIAEGTVVGYYLFYNSGNNYLNLNEISKFNQINELKINNEKFTITSSVNYLFVDTLCLQYSENDLVAVEENFKYYGNGHFSKSSLNSEYTVLDLLKRETNYLNCSEVK